MGSQKLSLGLVPLARSTFDTALARDVFSKVSRQLKASGFDLTGPQTLVETLEAAKKVGQDLTVNPPDLLIVLQTTFADSTMVMDLAAAVDVPLLLWAVPEAPTGGRLSLNSLCGINLAAHALKRAGYRYDFVYTQPEDPAAIERVRTLALAGQARRLLHNARIGRLGENPEGLDTCQVDPGALKRRFGLEIVQFELDTVFQAVRTADEAAIDVLRTDLATQLEGLEDLDQTALRGTLGTYLAMNQLTTQENLDGLAVRCWPEFFTQLGCAACGAMSMLSDALTPCSCEADVNGTVTQLILQWLSGRPAFGTDLVSVDVEKDLAVVWHCGLAPLSMADPDVTPRGTIHSNRKLPLLMEFPLKPGRVTIARLSETNGDYRLVVGGGEMLQAPMSFTGTSGVLRFDRPATEVLEVILKEGLEHHISLTYGDHGPALLALCELLDLPVLHL